MAKDRKSKKKRDKYIAKISSDGKIDKKEAKKAAKKGISLDKIRNKNIRNWRKDAKDFDNGIGRSQGRNPAQKRPVYEPLLITRGASKAQVKKDKPRSEPKKSAPVIQESTPKQSDYGQQADDLLSSIDARFDEGGELIQEDPMTMKYAASSIVEPGNNLTIGSAADPSKVTGTGRFKRRKKKKPGLLNQIGKNTLGNLSSTSNLAVTGTIDTSSISSTLSGLNV